MHPNVNTCAALLDSISTLNILLFPLDLPLLWEMGHQQLYWSHPRKFGQGSRSCRVCANRHRLIRRYGLNMCRQFFRQYTKDIGFVNLD
ncbi:small ribosomal subunit protein uS14-like [Narcine bancroftii]|uniref:small ribosomal subunit protein uS14-like n=1 Tax=Narcine bancroftii TaxID=1343680 RepID=UPI003831B681